LGRPLYNPEKDRFIAPYHFGEWLYDLTWLRYDIDYNNPIDEQTFCRGIDPLYNLPMSH
jgi:hypothetical protein